MHVPEGSFCSVENSTVSCHSNLVKREKRWTSSMADRSCQSHGCTNMSNEKQPQIYLYTGTMAERRDLPSFSIGVRLE